MWETARPPDRRQPAYFETRLLQLSLPCALTAQSVTDASCQQRIRDHLKPQSSHHTAFHKGKPKRRKKADRQAEAKKNRPHTKPPEALQPERACYQHEQGRRHPLNENWSHPISQPRPNKLEQ